TVAAPIVLAVDQCQITGTTKSFDPDKPHKLKAKLLKDSSIEFNSLPRSLILTLSVPADKASGLLPQAFMPVTAIKFEALDGQNGKLISSLIRDTSCDLTYPDYQGTNNNVSISSPAFLSLDGLRSFNIEQLTYNPGHRAISLRLEGVASKVSSGSSSYQQDHR